MAAVAEDKKKISAWRALGMALGNRKTGFMLLFGFASGLPFALFLGTLFAWLTESLLGLDVVILSYPGHVATAVAFSGGVGGDHWAFNGKQYVVADPTYINADVGMTIPRYAGVTPDISAF